MVRTLVAILFAAIFLTGCWVGGDGPATVVVDGRSYSVSVVRGLVVDDADLSPYGRIVRPTDPTLFQDDQAYALRGVDALDFLVVRAKPGLTDDGGSWGDFIGLMGGGGQNPALCRYFVRLVPTWCDLTPSTTNP